MSLTLEMERAPMSDEKWIQKALERAKERETLAGDGANECYRLVDRDTADVVVDRYGPCLWVSWLRPHPPTGGTCRPSGNWPRGRAAGIGW